MAWRPEGIDVVLFDGGGAHRSAATALTEALGLAGVPDVRLVNTADVFPPAGALHAITEFGIWLYNACLRDERMYFLDLRRSMQLGTGLGHWLGRRAVDAIAPFFREGAPRTLVTFVPMHQRLLLEAARRHRPDTRMVVVPVDLSEIIPRYWFDPGLDADYLVGTERLYQDALTAGIPPGRLQRAGGMVIAPRFTAPRPVAAIAATQLARLGLDPSRRTVLLSFGAQGSRRLVDLARRLDASSELRVNLICLCGRSQPALEQLRGVPLRSPSHVVGFVRDVPELMRLSDVLVGKPGPVSMFEALASRLPLVLWDNPAFGVLFDHNLAWLERQRLGRRIRTVAEVTGAVASVLGDEGVVARLAEVELGATQQLVASLVGRRQGIGSVG